VLVVGTAGFEPATPCSQSQIGRDRYLGERRRAQLTVAMMLFVGSTEDVTNCLRSPRRAGRCGQAGDGGVEDVLVPGSSSKNAARPEPLAGRGAPDPMASANSSAAIASTRHVAQACRVGMAAA